MSEMDELIKKAKLLYNQGNFVDSCMVLVNVLRFKPDDFEGLFYVGKCLVKMGNFSEAAAYLENANGLNNNFETKKELGLCYLELKDLKCKEYILSSLEEKFDNNLAKNLENFLSELKDSEGLFELKLLSHKNKPKDIYILRDLTTLAKETKKYVEAIKYYEILLRLDNKDYVAWNNLGLVYEDIGEWEKAYNCYRRALNLKDFFSPNFNLGIVSRKLHKFNESIKYLKKAVIQNEKSAQAKYSLAMSYMMTKDFKNGYPLYAKHMTEIMPFYYRSEWDGMPHPDKTLLIFTTGGLGDILMFLRYLEYLKDSFKKIFIQLPKTLHKIIEKNFPYAEPIEPDVIFGQYDYAITPMHILQLFNLDFNEIMPGYEKFIEVDEAAVNKYKEKYFKTDKLKIALNWHGNTKSARTFFNRTTELKKFTPILNAFKDKAQFYSIQKDDTHIETRNFPEVIDLYDEIDDFYDTAAILKNIDLLISIDSSPIHMAGALGIKTFAMLPYANEWRWFAEDTSTIWYKSVKLFRQDKEGDWDYCINKILEEMNSVYA